MATKSEDIHKVVRKTYNLWHGHFKGTSSQSQGEILAIIFNEISMLL